MLYLIAVLRFEFSIFSIVRHSRKLLPCQVFYTTCAIYLWNSRRSRGNQSIFLLAYMTILLCIETIFQAVQARNSASDFHWQSELPWRTLGLFSRHSEPAYQCHILCNSICFDIPCFPWHTGPRIILSHWAWTFFSPSLLPSVSSTVVGLLRRNTGIACDRITLIVSAS